MKKKYKSKTKILVIALVIGIILATLVILEITKRAQVEEEVQVEFPIDSAEEAIAYAKRDPRVRRFIWGVGTKVLEVCFDDVNKTWAVWFVPESPAVDACLTISFKSDGTVLNKCNCLIERCFNVSKKHKCLYGLPL
ncbi:MAG: hypothetical protein QMD14_04235 [Candidatus Aenigmarchaeota archaeon]|nr:hypothetical protein [Candidatus Aenigmarchaeota archaeon]